MKAENRLALLALTLALAACGSEKKPAAAGTAGGEVLPGSVSDAMLPVDTVRSQPPLAPKPDSDDDSDSKSGGKKADRPRPSGGSPEPTAAPTPPAEAASEPKPAAE